jgi:hypothetical protein
MATENDYRELMESGPLPVDEQDIPIYFSFREIEDLYWDIVVGGAGAGSQAVTDLGSRIEVMRVTRDVLP